MDLSKKRGEYGGHEQKNYMMGLTVHLSDDGRYTIAPSMYDGCFVWDNQTGELVIGTPTAPDRCSFAPGANKLFASSNFNSYVVDLDTKSTKDVPFQTHIRNFPQISRDGKKLAVESYPQKNYLVLDGDSMKTIRSDAQEGSTWREVLGGDPAPRFGSQDSDDAVSKDGNFEVNYHYKSGFVQVVDRRSNRVLYRYAVPQKRYLSEDNLVYVRVSPDSKTFTTLDHNGDYARLEIREMQTGRIISSRVIKDYYARIQAISPDGSEIMTFTDVGKKEVALRIDTRTGKESMIALPGENTNLRAAKYTPDGNLMAIASLNEVRVFSRNGVCPGDSKLTPTKDVSPEALASAH